MPKLNLRESDPNPQITFITALPLDVVLNGARQRGRQVKLVDRLALDNGSSSSAVTSSSSSAAPIPSEQDALQMLKMLAAQVSRIMKSRGMRVNSFEEYPYNKVFAGRNWNHGEVVELVLRKPDGRFWPVRWLQKVLCHEVSFQEPWHQVNRGKNSNGPKLGQKE